MLCYDVSSDYRHDIWKGNFTWKSWRNYDKGRIVCKFLFSSNFFLLFFQLLRALKKFSNISILFILFFRLLDIIWKRSMNPLLYYDSIYSITTMKKQEDSHRQFIFDFISNEWNNLIHSESTASESANSFIHQLIRISKEGRNFTKDEVNDHIGTMLVAVSQSFCLLTQFHIFQPLLKPFTKLLGNLIGWRHAL